MKETSLCYIEYENKILMLHRTKKENDVNEGKWIGIGGKFRKGETPQECVKREVFEETGLKPSFLYRGVVNFVSDIYEDEIMHLFTAKSHTDNVTECTEGELRWVGKDKLLSLNMWEGDKVFLDLIKDEDEPFFNLTLTYEGDKLKNTNLTQGEI